METVDAMRGPNSTSLIPAALECTICQEIMLHPYCLSCGHTFCGLCLKHWMVNRQQNENDKTCPACRDTIKTTPVPVHALRELSLHVLQALEMKDPGKAAQVREAAAGDPGARPFDDIYYANPIRDEQDEVVRCQNCMWEIQDGECVNCGQAQGDFEGFSDYSEDVEVLSNDDEDMGSDDLHFINDEDDSDEPDAIANIHQRFIDRQRAMESDSGSDSGSGLEVTGVSHRPIVISDSSSSDVMSPEEESEAMMTDCGDASDQFSD